MIRTLLDTVFLVSLMIWVLVLGCHTLDAVIEVVLGGSALGGAGAVDRI